MSNIDRDPLGMRMKENYEHRTRSFVPRRTYTLIRLDGKAFHTYTKGLNKPFDHGLIEDMNAAVMALLGEIQGAVFAYTQSDEISVLLTDFDTPQTCAWFDGNIQKIASVSASIMTAEFNRLRLNRNRNNWNSNKEESEFPGTETLAYFDSRVFTIPDRTEVMNYFRWRQQDCIRNSVSMVAQSNFSHKQLHGKSQRDMHDMLHNKGVNWTTDFTDGEKNGRIIVKETETQCVALPKTEQQQLRDEQGGIASTPNTFYVPRSKWAVRGAWVFTKDEGKLLSMIPKYESD